MEGKTLKFAPPTRVVSIGSHAEGGCFNVPMNGDGGVVVDVAVEMPRSFFQEKDYLDHRYHFKRAVYLDVLHKKLSKSSEWSCEVMDQHRDARKPYITVHFGEKQNKKALRLFLTIDPETFASVRLLPNRANVRRLARGDVRPASPHYNQSIAEDMYARMHAQFFAAASKKSEEFARCGGAIQAMGAGEAVASRGWRQWIFHFDALRIYARARWPIEQ